MLEPRMPPALRFLVAAREVELQGLETLAKTCELVTLITTLIHVLQRERGYTNLYLANLSGPNLTYLNHLSNDVTEVEAVARKQLDTLALPFNSSTDRARWFNRIGHVLHSLDELAQVRAGIRQQSLNALQATDFFTCLIERLLAIIFEAAHTAVDPCIARVLVALFNFLLGKELAAQERACAMDGFAQGFFDEPRRACFEQLTHSQERCFEVFLDFADEWGKQLWFNAATSNANAQQAKMRALALRTSPANRMVDLSQVWFDVCAARIDTFRQVEGHLSRTLHRSCEQCINQARADLQAIAQHGQAANEEHSIAQMLEAQTQRLARANEQLVIARAALDERQVVEGAKQLLMAQYQVSDSQAYVRLRNTALERGEPMARVAQSLLDLNARRG